MVAPDNLNAEIWLSQGDTLQSIVARVMRIDGMVWQDPRRTGIVARFEGKLLGDSEKAYDYLENALKPYNLTPLFRVQRGKHVVLLAAGVLNPKPSRAIWNAVLFVLTVLSVFSAGVLYSYQGPADFGHGALPYLRQALLGGLAFTVSLLAILVSHEFGHYLMARRHGTAVTLPYFIPFPLSLFGTLGAFISLKAPPRNKKVLMDIGIAGPLAGMVVALPVLVLGLALSHVEPLPSTLAGGTSLMLEGNSVLYLLAKLVVFGKLLPAPPHSAGFSAVGYWVQYFFTGHPLPLGGEDVVLHPIAWAGWAGLLVTALNLIPLGTLDGGHVLFALLGEKARRLFWPLLSLLLLLGFVWSGWWIWAFLLLFLGRMYAEPLDQITPLDKRRRAIAWFGMVLFLLVFTPVPLQMLG